MDNTDGVAQSLSEIEAESDCRLVVEREALNIADIVRTVADVACVDPIDLAFGPRADFSLVGTVAPDGVLSELENMAEWHVIGRVEEGSGVHIADGVDRRPLRVKGWDYFVRETGRATEISGATS